MKHKNLIHFFKENFTKFDNAIKLTVRPKAAPLCHDHDIFYPQIIQMMPCICQLQNDQINQNHDKDVRRYQENISMLDFYTVNFKINLINFSSIANFVSQNI